MALESGGKSELGYSILSSRKPKRYLVLLLLRVATFFATAGATIVMGLNKETKTFAVATVGSTPIKATLTAKFQQTPAFVFFVIANAMASFHNLVMIAADVFGQKFDYRGLRLGIIAISDMMTLALLSAGVNAAAFMAELGKNGNKYARWEKICDKFEPFCNRGGAAIFASFLGVLLLSIISVISIIKLIKPKSTNQVVVVP